MLPSGSAEQHIHEIWGEMTQNEGAQKHSCQDLTNHPRLLESTKQISKRMRGGEQYQ